VTPPHQGIKGVTESQLSAREAPAYSPHDPCIILFLRERSEAAACRSDRQKSSVRYQPARTGGRDPGENKPMSEERSGASTGASGRFRRPTPLTIPASVCSPPGAGRKLDSRCRPPVSPPPADACGVNRSPCYGWFPAPFGTGVASSLEVWFEWPMSVLIPLLLIRVDPRAVFPPAPGQDPSPLGAQEPGAAMRSTTWGTAHVPFAPGRTVHSVAAPPSSYRSPQDSPGSSGPG
jgi:hypothetical protein